MFFAYGWGDPYWSGSRMVYSRKLPNGLTQEVDVADVTSHIVKHGASYNAGSANCPQSLLIQMSHHKNKTELRTYQTRKQQDLRPFRQLLNIPPHLHPDNRAISHMDVYGKVAQLEVLTQANHAKLLQTIATIAATNAAGLATLMSGMLRVCENVALANKSLAVQDLVEINEQISTARASTMGLHVAARTETDTLQEIARQNDRALRMYSSLANPQEAGNKHEPQQSQQAGPNLPEEPPRETTSSIPISSKLPMLPTQPPQQAGSIPILPMQPSKQPSKQPPQQPPQQPPRQPPQQDATATAADENKMSAVCFCNGRIVDVHNRALTCVVRRGKAGVYESEAAASHANSLHKSKIMEKGKPTHWTNEYLTKPSTRLETHRCCEDGSPGGAHTPVCVVYTCSRIRVYTNLVHVCTHLALRTYTYHSTRRVHILDRTIPHGSEGGGRREGALQCGLLRRSNGGILRKGHRG